MSVSIEAISGHLLLKRAIAHRIIVPLLRAGVVRLLRRPWSFP